MPGAVAGDDRLMSKQQHSPIVVDNAELARIERKPVVAPVVEETEPETTIGSWGYGLVIAEILNRRER